MFWTLRSHGGQHGAQRDTNSLKETLTKPRSGEFVVERISYGIGMHTSPRTGLSYDDVVYCVHLQRNAAYYMYKGVLPLYGIMFLSNLTFFIDVALLSDRLALIFGMFLTAFAIQWTILDRLPRVPYLTFLDRLIAATIFGLILMSLGSSLAHKVRYPNGAGSSSGSSAGGTSDVGSEDAPLFFLSGVSREEFSNFLDTLFVCVADISFVLLHAVAHSETVTTTHGSSSLFQKGFGLVGACFGKVWKGVSFVFKLSGTTRGGQGVALGQRGKRRRFKQGGQGFHRVCNPMEGHLWRFEDLPMDLYDEKGVKKSSLGKGVPVKAANF
ncbi:unnamed protein product [Amoebophrya sp. A120]|nr:unnamed protein product [Amoebophrya sp. A120]|eukprot:GSA120T00005373001.1